MSEYRRATIVADVDQWEQATTALYAVLPGIVTTFDVILERADAPGVTAAYWAGVGGLTQGQYDALAAVAVWRLYDGDAVGPDAVLATEGLVLPARGEG